MSAVAVAADPTGDALERVLREEAGRCEMVGRVSPAAVCIFDAGRRGGGSGVLIDPAGYGLTNFHVVAGMLGTRRGWGGLSDGELYELEVLGIDPTGDVAMFRLTGREAFPHAELGDSDEVRVGDRVVAMGNPFILSQDYTPSVTSGLVTGVHRYQWGVGGNLTYSDAIQTDAAINPGNSGGPLFDATGKIIGINGRISVNTRGRFNVGFGYAITSNQIQRFIPALRAGLLAMHGTLQAVVNVETSKRQNVEGSAGEAAIGQSDGGRSEPSTDPNGDTELLVFVEVSPGGAADRAGVRAGDALLAVDGVAIRSANHFVSVLGTYPAGRNIALALARSGEPMALLARLDPIAPDLQAPFEPDPKINRDEVRRVLRAFQRAVLGTEAEAEPSARQFGVVRADGADAEVEAAAKAEERYRWEIPATGPMRITRRYGDGSTGRTVETDGWQALGRARLDAPAHDLSEVDRMIHAALFALHRTWLRPIHAVDLTGVGHAGGDAFFDSAGDAPPGAPREVEVIYWPLGDNATARLSFDRIEHRLLRMDLLDKVSGAVVSIRLREYRDTDGLTWPAVFEVRGADWAYRDTLVGGE